MDGCETTGNKRRRVYESIHISQLLFSFKLLYISVINIFIFIYFESF